MADKSWFPSINRSPSKRGRPHTGGSDFLFAPVTVWRPVSYRSVISTAQLT
jgi:hypothetical protein